MRFFFRIFRRFRRLFLQRCKLSFSVSGIIHRTEDEPDNDKREHECHNCSQGNIAAAVCNNDAALFEVNMRIVVKKARERILTSACLCDKDIPDGIEFSLERLTLCIPLLTEFPRTVLLFFIPCRRIEPLDLIIDLRIAVGQRLNGAVSLEERFPP